MEQNREYRRCHPARIMLHRAKQRAIAKGIAFSVTIADVQIPERCPLLGIALVRGIGLQHPGSPSLDRKNPMLGYVPGNVWVISNRANTLKGDATVAELALLTRNLRAALRVPFRQFVAEMCSRPIAIDLGYSCGNAA